MDVEMEDGHVAAASCRTPRTVAFSWEHEPGVSKQSPVEAKKPSSGRTPAPTSTKKADAHRLRVPPPPGGPGAPATSPSASRRVRPEEDPFLAAYLACTTNGRKAAGRAGTGRGVGAQKLLGWAGLRHGLGLGASCKSSCTGRSWPRSDFSVNQVKEKADATHTGNNQNQFSVQTETMRHLAFVLQDITQPQEKDYLVFEQGEKTVSEQHAGPKFGALADEPMQMTKVQEIFGVHLVTPPWPPPYVSPRERTKQRKMNEKDKVMGTSAASGMEDRRTQ